MPELWELNEQEAADEADRLDARRRDADRVAAGLYAKTCALLDATDQELETLLPPDEAEAFRAYLAGEDAEGARN